MEEAQILARPILSAEALEQVVIKAVFSDAAQCDGERLQDE